jgi:hypothetical protein
MYFKVCIVRLVDIIEGASFEFRISYFFSLHLYCVNRTMLIKVEPPSQAILDNTFTQELAYVTNSNIQFWRSRLRILYTRHQHVALPSCCARKVETTLRESYNIFFCYSAFGFGVCFVINRIFFLFLKYIYLEISHQM